MSDDVLVKVEGASKKFCRSLKRSLWYGTQDVAGEMLGRAGHHDELRKNEFWAVTDEFAWRMLTQYSRLTIFFYRMIT